MTREFDPVFAEALRADLERMAQRRTAGRSTALRRPDLIAQAVVAAVVLALVVVGSAGVLRWSGLHASSVGAAPTTMPYLQDDLRAGDVIVGRVRGAGSAMTGRLSGPARFLKVELNCRGTGHVIVRLSDGGSFSFDHPLGRSVNGQFDPYTGCDPGGMTAAVGYTVNAGHTGDPLSYTVEVDRPDTVWSLVFISSPSANLP